MHIVGVALYVHMGMMGEWGMDIDAIINKSNTKGMPHVGATFFMHMGMMGGSRTDASMESSKFGVGRNGVGRTCSTS
jgi:hypothetical protein